MSKRGPPTNTPDPPPVSKLQKGNSGDDGGIDMVVDSTSTNVAHSHSTSSTKKTENVAHTDTDIFGWWTQYFDISGGVYPHLKQSEQMLSDGVYIPQIVSNMEEFNAIYPCQNNSDVHSNKKKTTRNSGAVQELNSRGYTDLVYKTIPVALKPRVRCGKNEENNTPSLVESAILEVSQDLSTLFMRVSEFINWQFLRDDYCHFDAFIERIDAPSDQDQVQAAANTVDSHPDISLQTFINQYVSTVIGREKGKKPPKKLLEDFDLFLKGLNTSRDDLGINRTLSADMAFALRGEYQTAFSRSLEGCSTEKGKYEQNSGVWGRFISFVKYLIRNEKKDQFPPPPRGEKPEEKKQRTSRESNEIRDLALSVFDVVTYTDYAPAKAKRGLDFNRDDREDELRKIIPGTMKVVFALLQDVKGFAERKNPILKTKGEVTDISTDGDDINVSVTFYKTDGDDVPKVTIDTKLSTNLKKNYIKGKIGKGTNLFFKKKFYKDGNVKEITDLSLEQNDKPQGLVATLTRISDIIMTKVRISKYLEMKRTEDASSLNPHDLDFTKIGIDIKRQRSGKDVVVDAENLKAYKEYWMGMNARGWGKKGIKPRKPVPLTDNKLKFIPINRTTAPHIFSKIGTTPSITSSGRKRNFTTLPWIPYGFKSNGRELHICVVCPRYRIPGLDDLVKSGYSGVSDQLPFGDLGICKSVSRCEWLPTPPEKTEGKGDTDTDPMSSSSTTTLSSYSMTFRRVFGDFWGRLWGQTGGRLFGQVDELAGGFKNGRPQQLNEYYTSYTRSDVDIGIDIDSLPPHSVVDPGQRHPVSITSFGKGVECKEIHLLSSRWVDKHNEMEKNKRFEQRYRKDKGKNTKYGDVLEGMSKEKKDATNPDDFLGYCKYRIDPEMKEYRENPHVLARRIRSREACQRTTMKIAKMIAMTKDKDIKNAITQDKFSGKVKFVDSVFFGDGAVNVRGKGHRGYSKKGVIRAVACAKYPGDKRVQVVVPSEWGTSSRCPSCKCEQKLKSEIRGGGDSNKSQPGNGYPSEFDFSTETDSDCDDNESDTKKGDNRVEVCTKCKMKWPHDVVSIVNMMHISACMIQGQERPKWLSPVKQ